MTRAAMLALGVVLIAAGLAGHRVRAHAGLVSASPAPGSILPELPSRVTLEFSQALSPGTDIFVRGPDGSLASADDLAVQDRRASIGLRPAGAGIYAVNWKTVSAEDGDEASGTFQFGVGTPGSVAPSAEAMEEVHEHAETPISAIAGGAVLALLLLAGAFILYRRTRRRPRPSAG